MLDRQSEQLKNEARLRVLAAAVEEFARHGLANARVRSIVDAARVNLAAVNYYFGGKEGLYHAALLSLSVRLAPLHAVGIAPAGSPRERLQTCVTMILARLCTPTGPNALARILAHEALARSSHLGIVLEEVLPGELAMLRDVLRNAAGDDAAESTVSRLAERILGQCVLYLHGSLNCEPEAREILAAQIADAAAKETLRTQRTPVAEK